MMIITTPQDKTSEICISDNVDDLVKSIESKLKFMPDNIDIVISFFDGYTDDVYNKVVKLYSNAGWVDVQCYSLPDMPNITHFKAKHPNIKHYE